MMNLERFVLLVALPVVLGAALLEACLLSRCGRYDWQAFGVSMVNLVARHAVSVLLPLSVAGPVMRWAWEHRLGTVAVDTWWAELEAQGLLARAPHASDARQSVLSLTRAGLAQLKAVARSRESSLATAMAQHLSAEEIAALQAACALMDRVAAAPGEGVTGADAQA
jgi:hypothetical protein